MKAIILNEAGGTENLVVTELPMPVLKEGEVLVKVKAIGINPVDIKTRKGLALYNKLKEEAPVILGWDIAGEVVEVGPGVTNLEEGDEVFGMVNFPGHGKAYAEYVAAPANHLAEMSELITPQEAVAGTLAALTAWQVLIDQANVQPGEKVLIHAAAGGVGHYAVQIAKYLGAHVIGTASDPNYDFVKELGADEFVDYTQGAFEDSIEDVDVVFDTVGGSNPLRSLKVLKEGGRLVAIAGGITEELTQLAEKRNIKAIAYLVHSNGDDMEQIAELLEAGTLKSHVSKEYSFEQVAEAHKQIETGKTRGKIVIVL
ncbi:NADP-dependent oxidoreductase [Segetibacter sp.]|jgi:NADPH:quinone reductase-like Zn-dependent oxidoreductase|uniref:NADP-dependent oxidoreductase n=1 Tax=Segetibacter sp. TaxID=2231182 RepID=UPI0026314DEC|nr:NADP-dependent oxidoreductase [Segetibacter sp.]MCW3081877.1 oxidoreductase [Segetibacter sp.]